MKRRILSCFLAFCMIFALLPAPAQAAGNAENATPTVTATVQHNRDGSGAETGQITAQIEAYMTDPANKTRTVKPCDIIFLIEQSKFMNTQNGSANSGDERAEILSAIERLLDGMPLKEIAASMQVKVLVCAVRRGEEIIIPDGNYVLGAGDCISVTAKPQELENFFRALGVFRDHARNVMVVG